MSRRAQLRGDAGEEERRGEEHDREQVVVGVPVRAAGSTPGTTPPVPPSTSGDPLVPDDSTGYEKTLTARAITRPTTLSETIDCSAIVSLGHAFMGMTSVGLKAVLVVSPRIR